MYPTNPGKIWQLLPDATRDFIVARSGMTYRAYLARRKLCLGLLALFCLCFSFAWYSSLVLGYLVPTKLDGLYASVCVACLAYLYPHKAQMVFKEHLGSHKGIAKALMQSLRGPWQNPPPEIIDSCREYLEGLGRSLERIERDPVLNKRQKSTMALCRMKILSDDHLALFERNLAENAEPLHYVCPQIHLWKMK